MKIETHMLTNYTNCDGHVRDYSAKRRIYAFLSSVRKSSVRVGVFGGESGVTSLAYEWSLHYLLRPCQKSIQIIVFSLCLNQAQKLPDHSIEYWKERAIRIFLDK